MIFLAVGTQLPFDRMVRTVDAWVGRTARQDVFGQIGPGTFTPQHMRWERFIDADVFAARRDEADVVIAHAGMGSIIGALQAGKPIIIMPRRVAMNEHRNDHQLATAEQFRDVPGVFVADDEAQLLALLDRLDEIVATPTARLRASAQLLDEVRMFVATASLRPSRYRLRALAGLLRLRRPTPAVTGLPQVIEAAQTAASVAVGEAPALTAPALTADAAGSGLRDSRLNRPAPARRREASRGTGSATRREASTGVEAAVALDA